MNSLNPIDALGPAWTHMTKVLFRKFSMEKWIALGVLCFLQTCAGMGAMGGFNGGLPTDIFEQAGSQFGGGDLGTDTEDLLPELGDAEDWVRGNLPMVVGAAGLSLVLFLALILGLFWLGAHAGFAYLDDIVHDRGEVGPAWKRHATLAESFFRLRLILSLALGTFMIAVAGVAALLAYGKVGGRGGNFEALLTWAPLWGLAAIIFLTMVVLMITDIVLYDLAMPIQMLRRSNATAALGEALGLVGKHPGAFVLYLFVKMGFALSSAIALMLFGVLTCCCGFLLLLIPVVGQAVAQPVWVLHRSISLFFLGQFGPTYDVFLPPAPEGSAAELPAAS